MSKTYNNVAMSEEAAKKVAERDERWTGPRLIALTAATLGFALLLLWAMANYHIGPDVHDVW